MRDIKHLRIRATVVDRTLNTRREAICYVGGRIVVRILGEIEIGKSNRSIALRRLPGCSLHRNGLGVCGTVRSLRSLSVGANADLRQFRSDEKQNHQTLGCVG